MNNFCCPFLCPVSPSIDGAIGSEGCASIDDSPIPAASKSDIENVVTDEEVEADSGDAWQRLKGMPEPIEPSKAEVERHNLSHLPYKSWCQHCVAARRAAAPHLAQKEGNRRSVPLLVFDYAFLRAADEDETIPCLIGKMYPMRTVIAVVCDQKGRDPHVVSRLAAFIRENGVRHLVYKSDQEEPIMAMAREAIQMVDVTGEAHDPELHMAVPQRSVWVPVHPTAELRGPYKSLKTWYALIGLPCMQCFDAASRRSTQFSDGSLNMPREI